MRNILAAVALLLLAGCNAIPGYAQYKMVAAGVVDDAILERQDYNDKKGEVIAALACDISVGAYARMAESNIKQGVGLICGLGGPVNNELMAFAVATAMMNAVAKGTPLSEVVATMQQLAPPPPPLLEPMAPPTP